jgi:hypothetical protein
MGIVRRYMITFQVKSQVSISKNHPTRLNRGYETFPLPYPRDLRKGFFKFFNSSPEKCSHNPYQKFSAGTDHSSTSHLIGPPYARFLLRSQGRISRFNPPLTTSLFSPPFSHSDSEAKAFQKLTTPSVTLINAATPQNVSPRSPAKPMRHGFRVLENKFPDAGRFFGPAGEDKGMSVHEPSQVWKLASAPTLSLRRKDSESIT